MKSYRNPSFQDRVGQAGEAKKKALEQLLARPQVDEKVLAERQAARIARETAQRERRVAKQAAQREAEASQAAEAESAREAVQAVPTDAERKAARDARYAARKSRG
jgi:pantoate kinase